MVSNMQRMRDVNKQHRRRLKELGFYDIVFLPHSRWFKDVFGLWDGWCKKRIEGSESLFKVYWLQLKTGYAKQKDKKALHDFCFNSGQRGLLLEYVQAKKKYKNRDTYYIGKEIKVTQFGVGDEHIF